MSGPTSIALAPPSTPAAAPVERAQPPVRVQLGIAPQSLEEGWRLAQYMAKSSLVPKAFQNKAEDVLVAIELGLEVGLAPMQALQSIAVINGRPSIWGDGFLALIMSSPHYQDHDEFYEVDGTRVEGLTAPDMEKPTTASVCTFWRRGKATPVTQRFTIAQAKKAGLLGKDGPWQTYPDRMLKMRARGFAGRDAFPDVLRGIRTVEEAADEPIADERSVVTIQQPQRASQTRAIAAPAAETNAPAIETITASVETPVAGVDTKPSSDETGPPHASTSQPADVPSTALTVVNVRAKQSSDKSRTWWEIDLSDKAIYYTFDPKIGQAALDAKEAGTAIVKVHDSGEQRRFRLMLELTGLELAGK